MGNNKYYLMVGGVVIDFSAFEMFPNMEDFMNLSLFTAQFSDSKELIRGLKQIGFPLQDEEDDVYFARKVGKKFVSIGDEVLYSMGRDFLDEEVIKRFLIINRQNGEMICNFLDIYKTYVQNLIDRFKIKIHQLHKDMDFCSIEERKKLNKEVSNKTNSLNNFYREYANLQRLESLAKEINSGFYRGESLDEYNSRASEFVRLEANYVRGQRKTPNPRGLVGLAVRTGEMVREYPNIVIPKKKAPKLDVEDSIIDAYNECLVHPVEVKSVYDDYDSEEYMPDPDSVMLLDSDDFLSLIDEGSPQELIDSVEDSILNLEEAKRPIRK